MRTVVVVIISFLIPILKTEKEKKRVSDCEIDRASLTQRE